jgi:UDP-N-acetyl-2-amino-2-deoxyglucuronate dehydrogenase
LKFAIIGCGAIAGRHAAQAAAFGKLLAVCDIEEGKAAVLAERYEAKAYTQIASLLEEEKGLDIVAVCTPNGLHAEHSILALEKGFHVICEKPMAIRSKDAKRMVEAADKAGRHLFIVKQNRFNPPVTAVKRLLDDGKLGRIYSVQVNCCWNRTEAYYRNSWHGTREMDGGILFTQFSHFIDILYWMIGDVEEARSFAGNFSQRGQNGFSDTVTASVRFENGAIGSLHFTINSYRKNMEGAIIIVAEKGTVKIGGQYLNELEYQQMGGEAITGLLPGNVSNDYGYYQGSMSNHDKMYEHVVNVLGNRQENLFSGYEGLKTVEIIEKIYMAAL